MPRTCLSILVVFFSSVLTPCVHGVRLGDEPSLVPSLIKSRERAAAPHAVAAKSDPQPLAAAEVEPADAMPAASLLEDESKTSAGMPGLFIKAMNKAVQSSPQSVIVGLFRSHVFTNALIKFLQDSPFLEELLLRADLLTQALCGMQAKSNFFVGAKGHRSKAGEWRLWMKSMTCNDTCREALETQRTLRLEKCSFCKGTFVSGAVNMTQLLEKPGMTELFLKELTDSPGLQGGLTPERMSEPFSKLKIFAKPDAGMTLGFGSSAPATVFMRVASMRFKTAWQPTFELHPTTISSMIDKLEGEAINNFLSGTLSGWISALVSEQIILAPGFVNVLNKALAPAKMDLWVLRFVSASADLEFLTDQPRREELCTGAQEPDVGDASMDEKPKALDSEKCCCKKGACTSDHNKDGNFRYQKTDDQGQPICCKRQPSCGSWTSWSAYKTEKEDGCSSDDEWRVVDGLDS